mmetsp:Transcript_32481/g.85523  ORF Transcript_32481/g.85523 Transcript_32481/m.85523 type:complete len:255 (-) Transcript_32481:304-1068(-)
MGSLYLQKNTLISCSRICGRFCTIRLMFRSATYWISGSEFSRVTSGGASLRQSWRTVSWFEMRSRYESTTLTALSTTAELACCRRGTTRSMMPSASCPLAGVYLASESRMKTCPHSLHSLSAARSFWSTEVVIIMTSLPLRSWISLSAATVLATTDGFESQIKSRRMSRKPRSSTISELMSYSLVTQMAAVLRTYGLSSRRQRCSGSQRYSVMRSTRMQPIVRTARARMSGLGSLASFTNVFTASSACSGWLFA